MAASASIIRTRSPTLSTKLSSPTSPSPLYAVQFSKFEFSARAVKHEPHTCHIQSLSPRSSSPLTPRALPSPSPSPSSAAANSTSFHGLCYVVGDNIDTDQIIPAEYLTLVPSNPEEYEKLGSYALTGLPSSYPTRFVELNQKKTKYEIVIAGSNFGCGSSRELAPVALRAAGVAAVVAKSYARIFFRSSMASCGIYPLESEVRLCEECKTGDVVTVEMGERQLINHTTGKKYKLKPIENGGGGNMACGRQNGMMKMIPSQWAHIIVVSVCNLVMLFALLLVGQRKVTINNIINDHRQSLPKITSIHNHNMFGKSVCNIQDNVDQ